ncbi:MAG: threonylcarbamoyl-AMP synthase [Rickettsiales bacterium]|nr:threonylcarbamoyl-AMP synthase [Rickettsiales bacterium]
MLSLCLDDEKSFSAAAACLREGGLVAFPTETVYGLGADATNDLAVARIFSVKGRPSFNPLIVHVANLAQAKTYGVFNATAQQLVAKFWPGPLTLVVPRVAASPLSLLVSAGLDSVALRVPSHPQARALLHAFGGAIAAPSANRSGRLSPTQALHVRQEYAGCEASPDLLLEGMDCEVGVESTIVDCTTQQPRILRPGSITAEMLKPMIGEPFAVPAGVIAAPGMLASHYAPALPLRLNVRQVGPQEGLLAFGPQPLQGAAVTYNLSESGDLVEAASHLFAMMRLLDRSDLRGMAAMPIPMHGLGVAINDRLSRAAAPRPSA